MSPLTRMLLRDLWRARGQVAAAALVVACGITAFVTMRGTYASLVEARAHYYADRRFADVFCNLVRAPLAVSDEVAALPGVHAVVARIAIDATLDVPGLEEPATARVLSLPDSGAPALNDVFVTHGRLPSASNADEILVSRTFARANDLQPGSSLGLLIGGRWHRFTIAGLALSPEYIYEVGRGTLFPDNRRFGVMWLPRRVLAGAADMDGAFNDLALALEYGASERATLAALDLLLARYGSLGAYARDEQVSWRFLEDELGEIGISATWIPAIFLGVSAFLLYVVLARLVTQQRGQIGLLKAFGYPDWRVGLHYLAFAGVTVVLGLGLALIAGTLLGRSLMTLYADYFHFPALAFHLPAATALQAAALAASAAAVGAAGAFRRAASLPPAEAMRPEAPASFRRGRLDRVGLTRHLGGGGRMILRNLARRPWRAAASVLTIAVAVSTVILGRFMFDGVEALMQQQFSQVQREDVLVQLREPRAAAALFAIARLPGVLRAEPFRSRPVRLRAGSRDKRTELVGLPATGELRRLIGRDGRPLPLPPEGILLTRRLADELGIAPGGSVEVELLDGERRRFTLPVAGVSDEPLGISAWMDLAALGRVLREDGVLNGALLRIDPAQRQETWTALRQLPGVSGITVREAVIGGIRAALDRSFSVMTSVFTAFACVLVLGVVYNSARIALSERGAELSSLRVLGFSRGEVAVLLLGEQALLTALALPLGCLLGYALATLLMPVFDRELFRLPLVLRAPTFAWAIAIVIAAAGLSAGLVGRNIARLDLVAVLKSRT